jgi:hypothetical protein
MSNSSIDLSFRNLANGVGKYKRVIKDSRFDRVRNQSSF